MQVLSQRSLRFAALRATRSTKQLSCTLSADVPHQPPVNRTFSRRGERPRPQPISGLPLLQRKSPLTANNLRRIWTSWVATENWRSYFWSSYGSELDKGNKQGAAFSQPLPCEKKQREHLAGVHFSCISWVSPVSTSGVWTVRNLPPQAFLIQWKGEAGRIQPPQVYSAEIHRTSCL